MAKPHREWWIATAVIIAATIFRAGVFVFWERSHFDSDQAVMGLMAKHLIEGRAFPVYFYGQFYILGVEAWLAAPVFALFGPSVTALKLPLLAINIAVAVLLLRGFTREVGLRPLVAVVPTLFFALPAPGTAARFVAPDGGNVEPIFYGLLLWLLRHRPVWSGLVLGIGFLHREFTIYPFVAIVLIQAVRRDLFTRSILIRTAVVVAVAAVVWIGVQGLRRVSSAAGPHTTIANVRGAPNNVGELLQRTCVDPTTMASGVRRIVTEHWPQLFGASLIPLAGFSIVNEGINQGTAVSGILLATIVALAVGMVIAGAPRARGLGIPRHHDFCAFLVLASALSVAGYVVGRCGYIEFGFMRYELWSIAGAAGLGAWALAAMDSRGLRRAWLGLALAWFVLAAVPHVQLWTQYVTAPPPDIRRQVIAELDARGIRYGASRYWVSYALTFLTNERIILRSEDFIRVVEYQSIVYAHESEAIRIERDPCPGGEEVLPHVFFCR